VSHLHAVLTSPASNESISEDLFGLIGYDDMDMIVEILENRASIAVEVRPALGSTKPFLLSIDVLPS
jgi:hypothetical protein